MSNLILDLFFLVTLLQGAIRKWVAPSLSFEIQFFRDMLPVLALIICRQKPPLLRELGRFSGPAAMFLWTYAGVAVFEAWSPSLPVFVVVVGIRTHFAYLPLALLMPTYLKSWAHGLRKFRQLLVLAVPIFLLAFFQTTQPVGSVWNQYADPTADVATVVTDRVRATGTFAFISEFASFAEICAVITLFLMLVTNNRFKGWLLNVGCLVMALGAIMASGSRGPAATFGAQLLGIIALGCSVRAIPRRHLFALVAVALLTLAVSVAIFNQQATDFMSRAEAVNGDVGWRVDAEFFEWVDVIAQYPLGVGLGAAHQSVAVEMLATGTPNLWEVELSRLAFELGAGVFLYLAFKIALVGQILARMKTRRGRARITLVTCTIILIPLLATGSVYQSLSNAAFWAFVGVGFWIFKLEAASLPARPAAASVLTRTAPVNCRLVLQEFGHDYSRH